MEQRRSFLKFLLALFGSGALAACKQSVSGPAPVRRVKLGPVSRFTNPETLLFVERVLVRRDQNGLSAMSLVCTHQACMVRAEEAQSTAFICPCHGSRFDSSGLVLTGPASKDLPWLELTIEQEDTIWVLFGKEVTPDWRLKDVESV